MSAEWDVRKAGRRVIIVTREVDPERAEGPVPWQDVAEMMDPTFTETMLWALRDTGQAARIEALSDRIRRQVERITNGVDGEGDETGSEDLVLEIADVLGLTP